MTQQKQVYKCNICGNIIEVLHSGAGQLVCCGQPMELLSEKIRDDGLEKHVPVIERTPYHPAKAGATGQTESIVKVKVGSVPHPMEQAHYIEWIEIITDDRVYRKFLKPGDKPEVDFKIKEGQIEAREFCNLHGLWKT